MATIGDLVLIYQEEHPVFFARIEDICADSKTDWYQVTLLILQVPVVEAVWILREEYINGETFTMNGARIRLERVMGACKPERDSLPSEDGSNQREDNANNNNVISLFERKKP
jgi:hypothetical protein